MYIYISYITVRLVEAVITILTVNPKAPDLNVDGDITVVYSVSLGKNTASLVYKL